MTRKTPAIVGITILLVFAAIWLVASQRPEPLADPANLAAQVGFPILFPSFVPEGFVLEQAKVDHNRWVVHIFVNPALGSVLVMSQESDPNGAVLSESVAVRQSAGWTIEEIEIDGFTAFRAFGRTKLQTFLLNRDGLHIGLTAEKTVAPETLVSMLRSMRLFSHP